ncbi:Hypothetical protein SMAX5B_008058 [Scophthalmus maximus]|uniref:Uncharacterized protein n=1 Tax=Scophthalmus maximus TaxID=52904 RepID=A0A2U9BE24_SCOMX|nr:Hypothetical protein SMAX5B_008058 [Scophthalmus maximus]
MGKGDSGAGGDRSTRECSSTKTGREAPADSRNDVRKSSVVGGAQVIVLHKEQLDDGCSFLKDEKTMRTEDASWMKVKRLPENYNCNRVQLLLI